jgi:hypothetical protein
MGKGCGNKACLRVITPECIEKVRKRQQVVNWIDKVVKRTTLVIDVVDHFMVTRMAVGGLISSHRMQADKNLPVDPSYQYI